MAFAKTTRPAVIGALSRPRLYRRLDRARQRPVTWVWGPPGAGKTTLVAAYLVARRLRHLWYQIDEGDGDLATFFYYLGLAAPRRRRPMPLLTPEYRPALATFSRRYFRELYRRLSLPFTLVFDNYQEAFAGSGLHEVMRDAAAELPPGGRVIVISRTDPPAAVARLRAHGALEVVEWAELRFSSAEAARLARRLAPRRPAAAIRSLHELTDGWAAGLVLLLDQLRRHGTETAPMRRQPPEVLFDYFAGEVFDKADPTTQDVLLQAAFLPSLTAPLAQALTGATGAGDVLANLHRQGFFTNKQALDEPVYQFHALFRDFLLSRALRTFTPERRVEVQRRAARLLHETGQVEKAASLFRDAADWEGLARVITSGAPALLAQGRGETVEHWLASLPQAVVEGDPWLLYWQGICRLGRQHEDCRRDCQQALTTFREQRDATGMFLAWSVIVFSYIYESRSDALDPWIALLDELLREAPHFPSEDVEARTVTGILAAVAWRQPGHPQGAAWAERAIELTRQHPDLILRTAAAIAAWTYYWVRGDLARADRIVLDMRALMQARDVPPLAALNASVTVVWHEMGLALPSYRRTVSSMLELVETTGVAHTAKYGLLCGGLFAALSDGDLETAAPWLAELARNVSGLGPGFVFWYHALAVRDALLRGDVEQAARHEREAERFGLATGWPLDEAVARLTSFEVLRRRGREREARLHLERVLEIARVIQSPYVEFMARLAEAQLCFDHGHEPEGLDALRIAMALGRAGAYVNSSVWMPPVMAELCARALAEGIEVEYVRGLVRRRGLLPERPPVEVEAWPWPLKVVSLGRFAVLRDDQPLSFSRKVQRRPLAVLKAVIAFGGWGVREDRVIDALWPDAQGDSARIAFASAVHRLRRLLGHDEAVVRRDGEIGLDPRYCWIDVTALERALERAETVMGADGIAAQSEAIRWTTRATQFYGGPFLDGEDHLEWAAPLADRLRRRMLRQLTRLGLDLERHNRRAEAVDHQEAALRVDPCAEDVCRRLMTAYADLGRRAEVQAVYRRCREALAQRLGATPSAETETLLQHLTSARSPGPAAPSSEGGGRAGRPSRLQSVCDPSSGSATLAGSREIQRGQGDHLDHSDGPKPGSRSEPFPGAEER